MKVNDLLPEIYYKDSRDFAYIGRLFELIFNYMKTVADCVGTGINNQNLDANITDLLVNSLGFESKHEYKTQDLIYISSAFAKLIRNKGTKSAINDAIRLLLNSQKIKNNDLVDFVGGNTTELDINIPEQLTDIILLEDLFDYILPAGTTYTFTKITMSNTAIPPVNVGIDSANTNITTTELTNNESATLRGNSSISDYPDLGKINTNTVANNT